MHRSRSLPVSWKYYYRDCVNYVFHSDFFIHHLATRMEKDRSKISVPSCSLSGEELGCEFVGHTDMHKVRSTRRVKLATTFAREVNCSNTIPKGSENVSRKSATYQIYRISNLIA